MKSLVYFPLLAWLLLAASACTTASAPISAPSPVVSGSSLHALFEGITPCSGLTRPLPQVPAGSNCEQMIWKIAFYQEPTSSKPTTYTLESAYGLPKPNTNTLVDGGTPIVMEGEWAILTGTPTDTDAVLYQLNPDDPQNSVSFLKMSDDLLHLLDSDKSMMVGHAAWSYTLNRMDNRPHTEINVQTAAEPPSPTRPPLPPIPDGSSVLAVFEGRTPCHEIVFELMKIAPYTGCLKVKWRLTLYQEQGTGAPSGYLFQGTRTLREGSWSILEGTQNDPDAIVYQLHLDEPQEPVSFLRADENHLYLLDRELNFLVGNELLSYTFSKKVDKPIQ